MSEKKLLAKISEMYYIDNINQADIAKELNIHRSTISKLLKQAREENIVSITINYEKAGTYNIEKKISEIYHIKKVIVVPTGIGMSEEVLFQKLSSATNSLLQTILVDGMNIGFSWGVAMSYVAKGLQPSIANNLTCVPIVGGPSGKLLGDFHVNTITYEASKNLGAKALLIDAPAIVSNNELKMELMKDKFNQELQKYWKNLDVILFGLGSPKIKDTTRWQDFYGENILNSSEDSIVGDVVSRFYNKDGVIIEHDLYSRLIGISIEDLMKSKYRIAVAESSDKVNSIHAALKGRYPNILITTEETALSLIELNEKIKK